MTADDGTAAVHVVLSGAVQPDASGGVGDPLTRCTEHPGDCRGHRRQIVRLDLTDPALADRLGDWKFRSEHLGFTADYCTRYLAAHPEDRARYRLWGVALLEFLGRPQ